MPVALITGCSSGIGRALADAFKAAGFEVWASARKTEDVAALSAAGFTAVQLDVNDQAALQQLAEQINQQHGGLDVLINNAGEQHPDKDITDITEEQLRRTFQTNIFGMFFLTQAARPHLKKGAAIVNCTSVTMYQGSKELLDYSSTKGAITAFTRSLSENLIDKGIRVNAVAPGGVATGIPFPPHVSEAGQARLQPFQALLAAAQPASAREATALGLAQWLMDGAPAPIAADLPTRMAQAQAQLHHPRDRQRLRDTLQRAADERASARPPIS